MLGAYVLVGNSNRILLEYGFVIIAMSIAIAIDGFCSMILFVHRLTMSI